MKHVLAILAVLHANALPSPSGQAAGLHATLRSRARTQQAQQHTSYIGCHMHTTPQIRNTFVALHGLSVRHTRMCAPCCVTFRCSTGERAAQP